MNKRKVSFMLITMFVTSSIFSGCFVPYSTQHSTEVATALNHARAEIIQDNDSLYAYLNTMITRESSEVDGSIGQEGESGTPSTDDELEDDSEDVEDSNGSGDSDGPSVDEGDSSEPPTNDEVVTPPTNGEGSETTPPVEDEEQNPSEPSITAQSQVQIVKSRGNSELVGIGESYTPYGTIELSLKLSGKILESKPNIPVAPEEPDDGTGGDDVDNGEEENKPSDGGNDESNGNGSGEDTDKPSSGDGEQKPPTEDSIVTPDGSDQEDSNDSADTNPDSGSSGNPDSDGETIDQPSSGDDVQKPTEPPTGSEDNGISEDVEDTEEDVEEPSSTHGIRNYESGTLGDLIKKAYEEAKINSGKMTERKKLRDALCKILDDMEAQLSFEGDGGVKKIKMSSDFAPNIDDYIKNIIDLANSKVDGDVDPSNIALRIVVRNENVGTIGDKLLTNTVYSLSALEGLQTTRDITVGDDIKLTLSGLSNCKTGKAPALFISKNAGKSNLYETNSQNLQGTSKNDMYVTQFKNGVYLDMGSYGTDESAISIAENSIKFKNITFRDPDKSISRVEIQDERGYRYSCNLISEYTDTFSIEVIGLESDTSYIFTKLFIMSDMNGRMTTQELDLGCYDNGIVRQNYVPIRTIKQPEPKIQLASTNSSIVKLPNGIEINTVKNSDTALRYVFKVDNRQGNVLDLKAISLTDSESYQVEKMVDKVQKENYYILTLNNLEKNKDYGFVILELNYLDDNGNVQVSRKSLSTLNSTKGENTKYDNMTEAEPLPIEEAVQISLSDNFTSSYARVARVPILIDDLENRVTSIDVENPVDNPNAKVNYDNFILEFSDLKPETSGMFTIIFNCEDKSVSRETKQIKKYVQLSTTEIPDYDIKSTDVEVVDLTKVNIKLNTYNDTKSEVKSVTVLDDLNNALKATWDKDTSTIKLEGLKPDYTYTGIIIRLILENGKTVEYPLRTFKTVIDENRPKGDVAEFVRRVYKIALGREPENEGWNFWIEKLQSKELSATEFIAENLMTQPEFVDRELTKSKFVSTMYTLIVDRESEEEGQKYWEGKYVEYRDQVSTIAQLRIKIAREMMDQPEFKELVNRIGLKY